MKKERYEELFVSNDHLKYEFNSVGPKGAIPKVVQFEATADSKFFNLTFGNRTETGSIDDMSKDNNDDRNKILATIAFCVFLFTGKHPSEWVFFSGFTEWQSL